MRFFAEINRVDEDQRLVSGYAATEQRASDGMVVTRDAISAALDDYMEFANVREMHQPSAVGVTRSANVDDTGLYITAEVVDDAAWEKVKRGVYKGFSIGAKVTERDPEDRTVVRGIALREISLVDRPADPGAKIDLWHADGMTEADDEEDVERRDFTEAQRKKMAETGEAMPDGSFPIANRQDLENAIRAYGRAKNKRAARRHIMKRARALGAMDLIPEDWKTMSRAAETDEEALDRAEGVDTPADAEPGPAAESAETEASPDGDEDTAERAEGGAAPAEEGAADPVQQALDAAAAAMTRADEVRDAVERAAAPEEEHVERILPGAELRRGMYSVGRVASLLSELCYLAMDAQFEADMEGDNSPVPGKLRSAVLELAKAYKAMSDEELAELLNGVGVDVSLENGVILLMAADADLQRADVAEIPAALGERLQTAFDGLVARGWTPAQPEPAAPATDDLVQRVEAAEAQNATLLRTVGELTDKMTSLADTVQRVADATVAQPKTAGALARAVDKEEDVAGPGAAAAPKAELSPEDVQRVLDEMPAEERALLLTRAALSQPRPVIPVGR